MITKRSMNGQFVTLMLSSSIAKAPPRFLPLEDVDMPSTLWKIGEEVFVIVTALLVFAEEVKTTPKFRRSKNSKKF